MALGGAACGTSESGSSAPPDTNPPLSDAGTDADPPSPPPTPTSDASDAPPASDPAWQTLMTGDWTLPPGTEGYTCVRKTIDEDLYVNAFDVIIPQGTHHTLLTMGEPNAPDGITPCSAGTNRTLSVFGSGVGTDPFVFPKGVALKIPKGTQLLLNLHLFNTGQAALSGTSGTRIRTVPASEVVNVAEGMLAGTVRIDLPSAQTTTTVGYCTMSEDATIFAVAPHMHMLGVHEKAVAERAAGEVVLMDEPYTFDEQSYRNIQPVEMKKGERIRVECTHNNTTANRVTFGESTLTEMCFAGLYRFPADGTSFTCIR